MVFSYVFQGKDFLTTMITQHNHGKNTGNMIYVGARRLSGPREGESSGYVIVKFTQKNAWNLEQFRP